MKRKALIFILFLALAGTVYLLLQEPKSPPALPTPNITSGSGNNAEPAVIATQVTAQESAGVPTIPPPLRNVMYNEAALRAAAEAMKTTRHDNVQTIQSSTFMGIGYASQTEKIGLQGLEIGGQRFFEATVPFTMTYTGAMSVTIGVGTPEDKFWESAIYSVTDVQTQTETLPTGQQVITETASLHAEYLLVLCVSKVETPWQNATKIEDPHLNPPFPPMTDWLILAASQQGVPFMEDVLTQRALLEARKDGLRAENQSWAYDQANAAVIPGGWWHTWFVENLIGPLAKAAGFESVTVNFTIDPNQKFRCDGSEIK